MSIYVDGDYSNYHYLVSASDNYFILTNRSSVNGSWQEPVEYNIIYQYINPSPYVIEGTRTATSQVSFDNIDISSDFWDRADSPSIFGYSFLVVFIACYVLNILSRIVKRGGIFV